MKQVKQYKLNNIVTRLCTDICDPNKADVPAHIFKDQAKQAIKAWALGLVERPGETIPYTQKMDNFATGYGTCLAELRNKIKES